MGNMERFIGFVNGNLGKPLTTAVVSKGALVDRRKVQIYCKAVSKRVRKVKSDRTSHAVVYTFKSAISVKDLV